MLDKVVFVLRSLLEGPPNAAVQERVLSTIKWKSYARRLTSMYMILNLKAADPPRSMRRFNDRAVIMFSIVELLAKSTVLANPLGVILALQPVFIGPDGKSAAMVEFYRSRLCFVEVLVPSVDDSMSDKLEIVYFPRPTLYVVPHSHIEADMRKNILNK